jgi:cytoskeletal protein RodZ
MTRKLLVGAIVAGALTVTAGTALALSQDDQPSSGAAPTTTSSASATSTTSATTSAPTTAPTTSSSTPTGTSSTSAGTAQAELSADDAARIVRERVGGTVHEVEREVEHGRLEWKVEITGRDGVTYDVRVDAVTGEFTRVDQDSDGRDDSRDDDGDDSSGHGRHGGDDDRDDHRDDHGDHDDD